MGVGETPSERESERQIQKEWEGGRKGEGVKRERESEKISLRKDFGEKLA